MKTKHPCESLISPRKLHQSYWIFSLVNDFSLGFILVTHLTSLGWKPQYVPHKSTRYHTLSSQVFSSNKFDQIFPTHSGQSFVRFIRNVIYLLQLTGHQRKGKPQWRTNPRDRPRHVQFRLNYNKEKQCCGTRESNWVVKLDRTSSNVPRRSWKTERSRLGCNGSPGHERRNTRIPLTFKDTRRNHPNKIIPFLFQRSRPTRITM